MKHLFTAVVWLACALVLSFIALPLLALFLRVSPGTLVSQLGNPVARDALVVSLKTSLIAHALVLLVGTPAAWALARRRFRGRSLLVSLVELPLVLPPAVAGIALLAAFGRLGLLGGTLDGLGISISFTQTAVILAVAFVESPFYVGGAIAAFEALDGTTLDAARTLGAGPGRLFFRIALPLAAGGLGAGSALALARGLGEFGATIVFAGSLQGVTQTLPLAIYSQLDASFDVALAIGALFVVVGAALLVALKTVPAWTRSASTSAFRFGPTLSS
ncbi:MAG: molybdate transport system permease protein [Gaiellaceae bacterium]|nr:molybdate transport system permease protein [Gaiellaceae bacterium]